MINPPFSKPGEQSYLDECIFALEPSFHGLMARASESGWEHEHIIMSLLLLVERAAKAGIRNTPQ
uniref:hypothetical protein n=1 Tax=Brucella pseudintermedia TaxID=370111 RepID=UPI00158B66D8|nr:hypothetical protein [Brucella pseudintermedia]